MHGWIVPVLQNLDMGGGAPVLIPQAGPHGPTLHRRLAGRSLRRTLVGRLLRRRLPGRVLRVARKLWGMDFPTITVVRSANEEITYTLDFRVFPEVSDDGGVLSSPTVSAPAGITVGTPTVSTTIIDGIPIGQAILLPVSGGTASPPTDYTIECYATITSSLGTSKRAYKVQVEVR